MNSINYTNLLIAVNRASFEETQNSIIISFTIFFAGVVFLGATVMLSSEAFSKLEASVPWYLTLIASLISFVIGLYVLLHYQGIIRKQRHGALKIINKAKEEGRELDVTELEEVFKQI